MKRLQIALLAAFAVLAAAGLILSLPFQEKTGEESIHARLAMEGFSVKGTEGFDIKNDLEIAGIRTITGSGQEMEFRARVFKGLSKEGAAKLVEDKKALLLSMFGKWTVSYPGRITREIECPSEFIPEVKQITGDGWNVLLIKALASARLAYGVCSADSAVYNSARAFRYCKEKGNLFELEAFSKIGLGKGSEAEQIVLSGECLG
ncbi:MAG: hypothetical protein V1493_01775 [Candidatus Diapherotrites archaeon]